MGDHLETPSGVLLIASSTSSASMVLFHDSASEPVTYKEVSKDEMINDDLIDTYIVVDDPYDNVLSSKRQSVRTRTATHVSLTHKSCLSTSEVALTRSMSERSDQHHP